MGEYDLAFPQDTLVKLAADQNLTATLAATLLTFTPAANTSYLLRICLSFSGLTNGDIVGQSITLPAAALIEAGSFEVPDTALAANIHVIAGATEYGNTSNDASTTATMYVVGVLTNGANATALTVNVRNQTGARGKLLKGSSLSYS